VIVIASLRIELAAIVIDNQPGPFAGTKVAIALEDSIGRLGVEDFEGHPVSVHSFLVRDAVDLGVGDPHNLETEKAGEVLAIACSLANPRILFSSSQPTQLSSSIELPPPPTKVEVIDTPTGKGVNIIETLAVSATLRTQVGTSITLNEARVLDVASRLLRFRIFELACRTLQEQNIIEAIKSYGEAMKSARSVAWIAFLYAALEKAVNMRSEWDGPDFDREAAQLVQMNKTEIEEVRRFENRNKHALRSGADLATLQAGEARLPQIAMNLKKAADLAILQRI